MANTDSIVTVTNAIKDKISNAAASGLSEVLNPDLIFYGDQTRLPGYPAVCVQADTKDRTYSGSFRRTENTFTVHILVYHGEIRSVEENLEEAETLAESIESLIHADATLGGLVIDIFVSQLTSGRAVRSGTPVRASRLTCTAKSKTAL